MNNINIFNKIKKNINNYKNEKAKTKNSKKFKKKNLISFSKFKKYITKKVNNKIISHTQLQNTSNTSNTSQKIKIIKIDNALSIKKNRYTIYNSTSSKKQFINIYDSMYKNKLNKMLDHFMLKKNIKIVLQMIENNNNDIKIYNFIKKNYKFKNNKKNFLYYISQISKNISKYIYHNKNNKVNNQKPKILDVGVGNGKKLKMIKEFINCDIYGADVKSWGPYNKKIKNKFDFPFKYIKETPYKIPYKNKMFDCITLILTLHHCDDIKKTIKECKRLLKDNGIIVIIEHDIWNDYDNMIVNIQHKLYKYIFNEKKFTSGMYYNSIEWDIIFSECKLKLTHSDKIYENITSKLKYDMQFIGIYSKIL